MKKNKAALSLMFISILIILATSLVANPKRPAYLTANNPALLETIENTGFASMPLNHAISQKQSDTLLCFHTGVYQDQILRLINLIDQAILDTSKQRRLKDQKRIQSIQKMAWKIKQGILVLSTFCGIENDWPKNWKIVSIKTGDRQAYGRQLNRIEAAHSELQILVFQ